ncbi:MAG: DUF58 domain-containing protein [Chloroflexi bacterium]|nr:DUF58 domain-containing protein [Chloroflexota bacterium]
MRAIIASLLLLIALGFGFATGFPLFFRLAYVLIIVLALSRIWAWLNIRGVQLSRTVQPLRTQVGQQMEEQFEVRNTAPLSKPWLEVRDFSDLPDHHASMAFPLKPGQIKRWRVRTTCRQRGKFTLGPIAISSGDPFGFFHRTKLIDETKTLLVYPATVDLPGFSIPGGELPGEGRLHQRTNHITPVAAGVRDYQPGDSYNRIHWPSTARTGRILVKEFDLDPSSDIWILLDMYQDVHFGQGQESTEEYAVTIAASLAKHFLTANRSLGLMAFGEHHEVVPSDRGGRQQLKILESLAMVRATGNIRLGELISAENVRFGRNSTVIIITPATDVGWANALQELTNRGVRGAAIVLDSPSFGGWASAAAPLSILAADGTPTYLVKQGQAIRDALVLGNGGNGR